MLALKPLDPTTDLELYRQAYEWRTPKKHIQPDRMTFAEFTDTNPTHLTIGLFEEELIAVYFLHEWAPRRYDAHFTSKKGVSRETLARGAQAVLDLVLMNGAEEVSALIVKRNHALRRFVEQIGMVLTSRVFFTCTDALKDVFFTQRNQRTFVKYVKRA